MTLFHRWANLSVNYLVKVTKHSTDSFLFENASIVLQWLSSSFVISKKIFSSSSRPKIPKSATLTATLIQIRLLGMFIFYLLFGSHQ